MDDDKRTWTSLASRGHVVRRSLRVALVVGTVLVLINYGDKLYAGVLTRLDLGKILLTFCVPYCVSTYAVVSEMRRKERGR